MRSVIGEIGRFRTKSQNLRKSLYAYGTYAAFHLSALATVPILGLHLASMRGNRLPKKLLRSASQYAKLGD